MNRRQNNPLLYRLEIARVLASESRKELAGRLGISNAYLSQLMSGDKPTSHMSIPVVRACAAFLRIGVANCLLLSGHLTHEDFIQPAERDYMERMLLRLEQSPEATEAAIEPGSLAKLPIPLQRMMVLLQRKNEGLESEQ